MKQASLVLIFSALSGLFLLSCHKNGSSSGPYSSMDVVFNALRLQPKTVTIDAATGGSFYGNSGTRYIFPPNSFQTASGTLVTGTVQIQAAEYLQKGDMLFSKMLPISNNEPLLSGGELNVSATQAGQPVYMRPSMAFQANIPQPGTPATGMDFFFGHPADDTTQTTVNWIKNRDSNSSICAIVIGTGDTLSMFSDSLAECNADAFMTSPAYQNFTVTASIAGVTLDPANKVYGYTLYDNVKGIWPLGHIGSYLNGVFTEEHVPSIPVHFVIFTLINGTFYGGTLSATPVTGSNYTVTLTTVDPVIFKTQLNSL